MSSNRRSGMGGSPAAKPKDFKKSVKRIFIELGIFKYFILLAVLLSVLVLYQFLLLNSLAS